MSTVKFTIGADPEFFVKKAQQIPIEKVRVTIGKPSLESADDIVPICGLLGGTKEIPQAFKPIHHGSGSSKLIEVDGFAHQEDGAAAEFNIPPSSSVLDFDNNIYYAINHLSQKLKKDGLRPCRVNSLRLKDDWIAKHPNLMQIGCDPDYIAYDVKDGVMEARHLDLAKIGSIRGAGGHIHVGYPPDLCPPDILAKLMDLFVAMPLIQNDSQGDRRKFWGLAGLFRVKPYGMEYRTMSNWWIWDSPNRRLVSARTFALLRSLGTNMIAWQALYNSVNWKKVADVVSREDANAATKYVGDLWRSFSVLERAGAEAQQLQADADSRPLKNYGAGDNG